MPKEKKNEKKKKGSYFWRLVLICMLLVVAVGILYIGTVIVTASFDKLDVENYVMNLSSEIYYTDNVTGNPVSFDKVYSNENRVWVSYLDMPQHLKDAAVAIEDERFYVHHGVDMKRTIGAVINFIKDKLTGSDSGYGGSTITQQVVKNITGNADRTVNRKIREMWNSFRIERKMSKAQILELYLNTIYLSQGCNGVGAAAHVYFDKDVSELSVAEAAAIVGITQYPTKYDPFLNPESNKEKQELVLQKMLELGYLDKDEYEAAVAENLKFSKKHISVSDRYNSYFTDQVITDVANELSRKKSYDYESAIKLIHTGGFKIYSTMDPDIQRYLDKIYQDKANFSDGAESAMVIIDPSTGEVKGIAGGTGQKTGDFVLNRATMSPRQPGSSIKPIAVYAPALEYGIITPNTVYEDKKVTYAGWSPKNFYSGFRGPMSIRTAVKLSTNTVAVQVLDDLGVEKSFNFLKNRLGITTLVDGRTVDGKVYSDKSLASLALGGLTDGMTVYEIAGAYSAFANEGIFIKPHTFTKVVDKNGKVILEADESGTVAMSQQTAKQVLELLAGVTSSGGTGSDAAISGVQVVGKTGTTDNNYDRWFVGITPYYVGAVWYGFDIPKNMGYYTYNPAISIWKKVMSGIHSGLPSKKFNINYNNIVTTDSVSVSVCSVSGLLPSDACVDENGNSTVVIKRFARGSAPKETCSSAHHSGASSSESGDSGTSEEGKDLSHDTESGETDNEVKSEQPAESE